MRDKSKKHIKIIAICFIIMTILFVGMMVNQKAKMNQLIFEEIDMGMVNDGKYIGQSDLGLVKVEVEVSVVANHFEYIKIVKHDNGRGSKAEGIVNEMIKSNSYEVDAVSGATVSSQAIKGAVCNALLKGVERE